MDWLIEKLSSYSDTKMYSFHTPGHKGREDLLSSLVFPYYDLTELPGLDMLHNPQGVIAEAQRKAAEVYGAEETFFLVNGATVGNQAMFMALMSKLKGKKIRIERKAHRSVIGALILSGLTPDYIPAVIHPDFNLPLGLDLEEYMGNHSDIGAFHLTSPSYYGSCINLDGIVKRRDAQMPDIPILVDQAHGAHFKGEIFSRGAVEQGADVVVHSTHKTMAALTQAAMLHVKGQRVSKSLLKKSLEILQSSSPSYLLMGSLEVALRSLEDSIPIWEGLHEEVMCLQAKLDGPLRILTAKDIGNYGVHDIDWSKILVNVSPLGINASEAVDVLRSSFRIEPELWDENNILFLLGVGSKPEEVRHLCASLERLVQLYCPRKSSISNGKKNIKSKDIYNSRIFPVMHQTPREAFLSPKRLIAVRDSLGQVAGETISIYPPGIPLVAAGEEITPGILEYLLQADNYNWQGWQGFRQGIIQIVDI